MLANFEPRTPRPRPPAKARRSSTEIATAASPPPPYMNDQYSFPDPFSDIADPVRATAQRLGVQLDSDPELSPTILAEVNDKSREELANLFLEAEKVIRAREAELAVAANIGKTLLETNQALKQHYDALLSRLPVMQDSPSNSPHSTKKTKDGTDAWTTDDEVPSLDGTFTSPTKSNSSYDGFTPGHRRRISASPSALMALQETNSELISELTRLREATEAAQVDGANRLRKLEREISGLRDELETMQKMNMELEEHMNAQKMEERLEWQEKLQKLRETQRANDSTSTDSPRDFAPHGHGAAVWDSIPRTPARQTSDPTSDQASTTQSDPSNLSPFSPISPCESSVSSAASTRSRSSSLISASEYAVVTQLYRKVEELQAANREFRARNRATHEEFARAEQNALEIKRIYDTIRDELGADADGEMSDGDYESGGTIRVRGGSQRLRKAPSNKSLKSITPKSSTWGLRPKKSPFEDGEKSKPRTRGLGNRHMLQHASSKARRPLTESLFIPPSPVSSSRSRPTTPTRPISRPSSPLARPASPSKRPASPLKRPASPLKRPASPLKRPASPLKRPASPLATRPSSPRTPRTSKLRSKLPRRNLESELSHEFGGASSWDPELFSKPVASAALEEARALEDSFEEIMERLGISSPLADDSDSDTARATHASATESMSTITPRRRPAPDCSSSPSQITPEGLTRRERALQRMMSKRDDELATSESSPKAPTEGEQQQGPFGFMEILRRTSIEALVEIWIILQFIVVICFFIYTMTKRGPRDVMGMPPKKKRQ